MALILFIDDEPDTLSTMEKAVQLLGHHALLAQNEAQALELAVPKTPDLVFVDMQLGETDGLSVVRLPTLEELIQQYVPAAMDQ